MYAFFKSFHLLLPLAEVSSISFASIMISTILSDNYLLKEKVGITQVDCYIYVGFIRYS